MGDPSNTNLIWIHHGENKIKFQILVGKHWGKAGQRGRAVRLGKVCESFCWKGMRQDVNAFIALCILCILSKAGEKNPLPLHQAIHGRPPNKVVLIDFWLTEKWSPARIEYLLHVKEDPRGYRSLHKCAIAHIGKATSWFSDESRLTIVWIGWPPTKDLTSQLLDAKSYFGGSHQASIHYGLLSLG